MSGRVKRFQDRRRIFGWRLHLECISDLADTKTPIPQAAIPALRLPGHLHLGKNGSRVSDIDLWSCSFGVYASIMDFVSPKGRRVRKPPSRRVNRERYEQQLLQRARHASEGFEFKGSGTSVVNFSSMSRPTCHAVIGSRTNRPQRKHLSFLHPCLSLFYQTL